MSDLDLYDESENLISSDDEFSEDDDDDLMNAAISSHHTSKSEVAAIGSSTPTTSPKDLLRPQEEQNKLKAIKLLMKRKKFSSFYKKRSIKWLNNKERREKYKEYLLTMKRNRQVTPPPAPVTAGITPTRRNSEEKVSLPAAAAAVDLIPFVENNNAETIELEDTDVEISPQKKDFAPTPKLQNIAIVDDDDDDDDDERGKELNVDFQSKQEDLEMPKIVVPPPEITSTSLSLPPTNNKRGRSPTPPPLLSSLDNHIKSNNNNNNNNEAKRHQPAEKTSNTTPTSSSSGSSNFSLYREINEMFPKYDEAIGQHLKTGNSTIDAIGENMTRILLDIQTLNDILQTKEAEWNRLLHLKNVKEEILTRLVRRKHILELREKYSDEQKCSLSELKELEMYLANADTPEATAGNNSLPTTAQQLVESRANMKKEDLEKERNNTNRLQSILISSNILPRMENSNNHFAAAVAAVAKDNALPKRSSTPTTPATAKQQQLLQSYQYLENRDDLSNHIVGRQGPFKDVKSIIADFRQKNPEVLPRVGKRMKMNDPPPPTISNIRTLNTASYLSQPSDVVNNLTIDQAYDSGSNINYTPTLEKLLSASTRHNDSSASIIQLKRSTPYTQSLKYQNHNHHHNKSNNNERQNTYYSLQSVNDDLCNEVSITPVGSNNHRYLAKGGGVGSHNEYKAELLRSALHSNQIQPNVVYIDESDHRGSKQHFRHIGDTFHESEAPVCQECKTQDARFVCAGCGNQWYCSRSCQISAWDKHSDSCSE